MIRPVVALPLACTCLLASCTRVLTAETVQAFPRGSPRESLLESAHLHIDLRDMNLPRALVLRQTAYFSVVSRDRLRFHVTLVHRWEDGADPTGWSVQLLDDRGHIFVPDDKQRRRSAPVTRMWDRELRTLREGDSGRPILDEDGWRRRVPLDTVDVYRGEGDLVFHARDLLHPGLRSLTLVMERDGLVLRYTWRFDDRPDEARSPGAEDDAGGGVF